MSEDDIRARRDRQIKHGGPDGASKAAEGLQRDLAARAEWEAARDTVRDRNNLKYLEASEDRADWRVDGLANEIARKPATSMVGIAVKLAIWHLEDDVADTVSDADWVHMTALGALHDAIRVAGLPEDVGRLSRKRVKVQS